MGVVDRQLDHSRFFGMSDADLKQFDIGRMNLQFAVGLPGAEGLDVDAMCDKLDDWATRIRSYTEDRLYRFERKPAEFGSVGRFRITAMITVLQRDLGVRYDPSCVKPPFDFSDSRTEFVHGILQGRGGTCVSLPVLYAAIGRRLGYPLHLCTTKEHCFVRWEGQGERFNIEATCRGFQPRTDEHFQSFPKPWTEAERRSGIYLNNLTRREEMAYFFRDRGQVFFDNMNLLEATENRYWACRIQNDHPHALQEWAVATMAVAIVRETRRYARNFGVTSAPLQKPPLKELWERQIYPLAVRELHRVMDNEAARCVRG